MKKTILALALLLAVTTYAEAQAQVPVPPVIGPGTPCVFIATEPTTHTDGTPIIALIDYQFYLDPPATGPVIGVTVPFFTVPRSAMVIAPTVPPALPGTTATASICKNMPTPITNGSHTASVSVRDANGQSAGSAIFPFVFQGAPPRAISTVTFN